MSIMNPLPPQAYTKETLVQAYAWLQAQSDHIKEIATTPDVLVSLFLKAKMQGDGALERPSIQNFKNELKNLAGMMGEFEVLDSAEPLPAQTNSAPTFRFRSQDFRNEKSQDKIQEKPSERDAPAPVAPSSSSSTSQPASSVDSRSLDMIQEVKNQFNLSSDTEAMRMLIAVGYNQVKTLLK